MKTYMVPMFAKLLIRVINLNIIVIAAYTEKFFTHSLKLGWHALPCRLFTVGS